MSFRHTVCILVMFMNYDEALNYIHSLLVFGSQPGLERIKELLNALGNPQDKLRFIHVAGTNGKGSVCNMLASVYKEAGYKTGLYTSPYIVDFRERIQLNGVYIPKEDLVRLCQKLKDTGVYVTEFEFITALAFAWFAEQKCDVVVLEVGLGGRFDATNVIKTPLASAIMKIDYDHTAILGNTLSEIAFEKCGIIKGGHPCVSYPLQETEALEVMKQTDPNIIIPDVSAVKVLNSSIEGNEFIYKAVTYKTALMGNHQIYNAITAIEVINATDITVAEKDIINGISKATVPARLELISSKPIVFLDGAHNPNGAEALSGFMKNYDKDIVAVIGMMADKNCKGFLEQVLKYCCDVITVTVKENPRSISAEELAELSREFCENAISAPDYDTALALAKEKTKNIRPLFVFGSLYLAGALREKLISGYSS